MELKGTGDKVTGKYETGRAGEIETFDIVGAVNGDLISFTVNWGIYGSITAWVGSTGEALHWAYLVSRPRCRGNCANLWLRISAVGGCC
jgi:hypothetical protein